MGSASAGDKGGRKRSGTVDSQRRLRFPRVIAAPSTGSLLLGEEDCTFRLARCGSAHGFSIGRADAEVVVNATANGLPLYQRAEYVRKKQVRHRFQLVSGRGMAGDLHAQLAKLLYRAPYFGTAGTELLSNARAADDDGGVVAQ